MTAHEDLTEATDLYEAPEDPEAREAFRITGPGQATWAMRKLRDARAAQADVAAVAQAEIDRIQAWATAEHDRIEHNAGFFEGLLTRWALDLRAADPRSKTVSTPYGEVRTRTVPGKWDVHDEALVVAWARGSRPGLMQVRESLRLADAKKALDVTDDGRVIDPETGEIVPGIEVGPAQVTATVTLAKETRA
jgi:hypothetical protein